MAKLIRDKRRGNWECTDRSDQVKVTFTRSYFTVGRKAKTKRRNDPDGDCKLEKQRYYYAEFESFEEIVRLIDDEQRLAHYHGDIGFKLREMSGPIIDSINKKGILGSTIEDKHYKVSWYEPKEGYHFTNSLVVSHAGMWIEFPVISYTNGVEVAGTDTFFVQFAWFNKSIDKSNGDKEQYLTITHDSDKNMEVKSISGWLAEYFPGEETVFIHDGVKMKATDIEREIIDSFYKVQF